MIGLKFKIKNEYNNFLDKILLNIDSNDYKWIVIESEVYTQKGLDLFDTDTYSNSEFKSLIKNHIHYTIFSNIQLYNKDDEVDPINNYDDFLKSKCILELFISDSNFVEIYTKNMKLLEILKNNAVSNEFETIELITSNENAKKVFSAYKD